MTKAKFKYDVTFSNGEKITRTSNREFKYAWVSISDFNNKFKGLTFTRENAVKEAKRTFGTSKIIFSEIVEI